jgi:hypothetical protein
VAYHIPLELSRDGASPALDHHGFCSPSVEGLAGLMRRVVAESCDGSGRAAAVGRAARRHMATHFSPEAVARVVVRRLRSLVRGVVGEAPLADESPEVSEMGKV